MEMTLAEKILARTSGKSFVKAGDIVFCKPDVTMIHDLLGPVIFADDFRELGGKIKYPERVVVIADHSAPPATVDQANVVKKTRDWAWENNVGEFYQFKGACHQLLVDGGHITPGNLVVGTDSHTCTAGALGSFGTGIGSTEMLGVLLTGEIWLRVPESILVNWVGKLPLGVMAKDAALETIGKVGHGGATYMAVEFGGSLISNLPLDERLVFANMAVEMGAKTGIIKPDKKVRDYLDSIGKNAGEYFISDDNATYREVLEFDATKLTPRLAAPHEVDNVFPVTDYERQVLDQCYIGSCTGGRLTDFASAAKILKGRKVSKKVRCLVVPASEKVWREASKLGYLDILAEAGCVISAPACGACGGFTNGVLGDGERCISSSNRNFIGRMGSKKAEVFLASPMTVAASAIAGMITDPRKFL
ncbi:MAG: 3-isopropylmalate dehydratase [Peptococcaceae bacterium BICA1-8]|nr:MAG: 3-isopropylmalate dehydratase [Peptococcaceae bacterium BICA1-8]